MYRIVCVAATSLLALSLVACSGSPQSQSAQGNEPAEAMEEAANSPEEGVVEKVAQSAGEESTATEAVDATGGSEDSFLTPSVEGDVPEADTATSAAVSEPSPLLKSLEWPTDGLATRIPRPSFTTGTITDVSETTDLRLTIQMEGVDDHEVADYVQALKAAGYVISANETSSSTRYSYTGQDMEYSPGGHPTQVMVEYSVTSDGSDAKGSLFTLNVFVW